MELTSYSSMPHRPCLLMKCAKATILLDTALNLETLATFHPYKETGKYNPFTSSGIDTRTVNTMKTVLECFTDAVPEVQPVSLENVDIETIDAVLISNWSSLLGLPFITERNAFHGVVYCTVPTKELGRLAMHELHSFIARIKSHEMTNEQRKTDLWRRFSTCTMNNPTHWRPIFTPTEIERCLSRIVLVSLGETKLINGIVKCTAQSSGHAIGSCNWIIEVESTKFGYVANSSAKSSHMRPSEWTTFKNLDYLILTSLTRAIDTDPYKTCGIIRSTMANALNKGGNVLFPVNPIGHIFDLLEVIFGALDEYKISRDVPVYFISWAASSTLAHINIFTEWLKKEKAVKVYNTEEPFVFGDLVRENRIKVYESITGAFSREYKTPCIVLTGHPSLHVGNVVDFLELWGQDKKSVIITTDPAYSIKDMYMPYRNLQIRAYDYPIETRLDMTYVNEMLLPELKPKTLIIPREYANVSDTNPADNPTISYGNIVTFGFNKKPKSFAIASRKRARINDELLLKHLKIEPKRARIAVSNLRGYLSTYDNDFEIIQSVKTDERTNVPTLPQIRLTGILTPENVIKVLEERGINGEHGTAAAGEGSTVRVPQLNAEIRIASGGYSSRIRCSSSENRKRIQRILFQCLEEI